LDVVASVINDKWVGLDITISQQVTRGAKLEGEQPLQVLPAEIHVFWEMRYRSMELLNQTPCVYFVALCS
jgi:hypothetical protein